MKRGAKIFRTLPVAVLMTTLTGLCFAMIPPSVAADDSPASVSAVAPQQEAPLEITADMTLEWHRNDRRYIARGDVVARQGDLSIRTDLLTADYRETAQSNTDIYRLTADGNVHIESSGNHATGSHAVYDVDDARAVLTGDNLALFSDTQRITARDRIEYHTLDGRLEAIGGVVLTKAQDKIEADRMSAVFEHDATGKRVLKTMTATGNVVITTPDEILTGRRGTYVAATNIATLEGGVTIRRGPHLLEGEKAEVNLETNVSRMTGDLATGHRVRGVFYPDSNGGTPALR